MPPENVPSVLVQDGVHRINPIAVSDWDRWLETQPSASIFHTSGWAKTLHDTYGFQPVYFIRIESGRLRALLPVMEIDSWLTGRRGVALPFTDYIPPLGDDAADFRELFEMALIHARERKWKYFECRSDSALLPHAPASTSFWGHQLALHDEETTLFNRCDESVRRSVRKAERSGLTVEFSQDMEAVRSFYHLLCLTRQRHGLPPQPFAFFANIQKSILAGKRGWVVLARQRSTPVAGAVYFHFGRSALYKYGASNAAFQNLRPNNLVMWQAIRRYAKEGFSSLDFGRTSLGNEGLRRFKLGWGTRELKLGYIRFDCRRNNFVTAPDEAAGVHTRLFALLPIPLSRMAGKLLYRHWA